MNKLTAAIVMSVLTSALITGSAHSNHHGLPMDSCSCSASDGSCDSSVTCSGGCVNFCAGQGDCYGACSGVYTGLGIKASPNAKRGNSSELVSELARISRRDITFVPAQQNTVFNIETKSVAFWDLLDELSERGAVQIDGQNFERLKRLRKILRGGERVSLCVGHTPLATFVDDAASITGLPIRIVGGPRSVTLNIRLRSVTLKEILSRVSEVTGTEITDEESLVSPSK